MSAIAVTATPRASVGKASTNAIRNEQGIPCVMYGGGEVFHFSIQPNDIRHAIYTPDFKTVDISLEGKNYTCIIKDVQFHPVKDNVIHLDFLRLIPGHPVKVNIPLRFRGSSPGIKLGGKLLQMVRTIKVKALPEKLVNELVLDISNMGLGQSVRVREIDVTDGIEILNPPSTPVAMIQVPRALRAAQAAAAAAAATAAGAGKKKK